MLGYTERLMERERKRGIDKEAAHVHASHMAGNGAWEHERGNPGRDGAEAAVNREREL